MAKAKYKNVMRTFLAVVTDKGKHEVLDPDLVCKYRLRAGMQTPLSRQPIISVVKRVHIEIEPEPKKRPPRKLAIKTAKAKKKSPAKKSRPKKKAAAKKATPKKPTQKKTARKTAAKKKVKTKRKAGSRK